MERKHFDLALRSVDADRRRIKFVASQEVVDRDGDVIVARGIETREFMQNPVLLADHDRTFVLGRVTRLVVETRPEGDALVGEADILPAGTSERVDEAWAAIRFGARNGLSIGFLPLATDPKPIRNGQTGPTFTRTRLLEISSVSLPSCQTCLVEEKRARNHRDEIDLDAIPAGDEIDLSMLSPADVRAAFNEIRPWLREEIAWRTRWALLPSGAQVLRLADEEDDVLEGLSENDVRVALRAGLHAAAADGVRRAVRAALGRID